MKKIFQIKIFCYQNGAVEDKYMVKLVMRITYAVVLIVQ